MKIKVFTDNDLDGACSALLIKKLYSKAEVLITEVKDKDIIGVVKTWFEKNSEFDKIYFTDLYIPDELVQKIDTDKVIIIDHHKSHVDVKNRYKYAKVIIEEFTSCCGLIYNKFNTVLNLTKEVKKLVDIVDDYDSYQLKFPETLKLNAIYSHYNNPRVKQFIESFNDGFRNFNALENNSISLYFKKLKDKIATTQCFFGEINGYKVISFFADFAINEVSHFLLKKTNADISMAVILNSKSVSLRKNKTCNVKLNKLAEILCDGGGHEYAAGGSITEKFLQVTKKFTINALH